MSKLIFYKETMKRKLGEIVEGHIDDDGNIFIYGSYPDIEDEEFRKFMEQQFATKYDKNYPVMTLAEWRDRQINLILDDETN